MTTATAIPMHEPDIDDAIELFRRNVLPLKCVAWAILRWRGQIGKPLTADELREKTGASRTAAYRAIHELTNDQQSRISGQPSPGKRDSQSRKAGLPVPESGTTTYQRDLEISVSNACARDPQPKAEPFEAPPGSPELPGAPGQTSPEAVALEAKLRGWGIAPGELGGDYGDVARRLCDHYPARWVEIAITCHVKLWGQTPGWRRLSSRLHEWELAGGPVQSFVDAFEKPPAPRPADPYAPRPAGGRPSPTNMLVSPKRRAQ